MFRINRKSRSEEVLIEIITISPLMLGHCEHCEILMKGFGIDYKPQQVSEYPEDLLEISSKITRFINTIARRVFARVIIVEAMSLRGLAKIILYGGGRLPIIAVNGRKIASGYQWKPEDLAEKILKSITGL